MATPKPTCMIHNTRVGPQCGLAPTAICAWCQRTVCDLHYCARARSCDVCEDAARAEAEGR